MHAISCCKPIRDLMWYHVYFTCNGCFNSANIAKRQGIPPRVAMAPVPHWAPVLGSRFWALLLSEPYA